MLFLGYEIDVQVANGLMIFVVNIPNDQRTEVRGLLGTPDGNPDNDFEAQSTFVLNPNATTEEIYDQFGETCE